MITGTLLLTLAAASWLLGSVPTLAQEAALYRFPTAAPGGQL